MSSEGGMLGRMMISQLEKQLRALLQSHIGTSLRTSPGGVMLRAMITPGIAVGQWREDAILSQ